jgi:hypothetical protein
MMPRIICPATMSETGEDIRKQANQLWKQAIGQLEEVKEIFQQNRKRLEPDIQKLRGEKDKLLKKLGEHTYKLSQRDNVQMNAVARRTVDRLNEVINKLSKQEESAKPAGKSTAKKATTKKTATKKKTTKKKVTKKKTAAKKTTTKKSKVSKKKATKKK